MIDQLANELIITSHLLGTNNIDLIGQEIGYRPLLITNGLYRGQEAGKFVWDKKKNIIVISEDVAVEELDVTEGIRELAEQIEIFITYLNNDTQTDMTLEEMMMFLGGTPTLHIRMAAFVSPKLTTYDIADPKDKESVYTFVTLKENAEQEFGRKQFDASKAKVSKRAKKTARKESKQAEAAE